jgi:two-component system, NarL family, nitrate/nitrite response regulator NarL
MDDAASGSKPIRLLLAVLVRLYRDGLAATLSMQPSLYVAASAASASEALALGRTCNPDVAIVDVSLDSSLDLIHALRVESANISILAFAVREDIATILEYAEAGADGFVTAQASVSEVIEAIERTAAGELLCSPRLAAQLLRRASHRRESAPDLQDGNGLTIREEQVFGLLRQGQSNKEIATALSIAEATVKNHVHHLLAKLQVTTRGQAAATIGRRVKGTTPAINH